ncbi:MAG TPA: adenylate/guanylate cyclase domain-containing protein [Actinomycetota bacterium]|nr:adenylate/guanylate cyclase domain-containing protein [Actinomycetota bacterium]
MAEALTFCFTDIQGSTRLLRALGEEAFDRVLEQHRDVIRRCVSESGGEEIHTEGDSFFLAFSDPPEALRFAAAGQRALAAEQWPDGTQVLVRMGLHLGPAQRRPDGDFTGLAVHRAARVAALAHGGQVLITEAAAAEAPDGCRLRPLGPHRLRDFDGPVDLFQLSGPGLPDGFPPLRAARQHYGLPLPATALLGRESELDRVVPMLRQGSVVTLVGPSGVGKTRLALEAAALAAPTYGGTVHFAELSSLAGPDHLLGAVASAIGARPLAGHGPEDAILAALAHRPAMLVLDSCERVLDAVASLIDLIVARIPHTTVLATSLEAIRLPVERVVSVAPLPVEPAADGDPLDSPAVRLLVDRAEARGTEIDVQRDGAALVEISRRLDGIPLALELAGARVAEMGAEEVVSGLRDRFALLTTGYRTALPRHRTLEAAVEWTVELLKPEDRELLARMTRLLGRWRLETAAEVAGGSMAALLRLRDRSLIVVEEGRVRLLDTIRAFMARELDDRDRDLVDSRRMATLTHQFGHSADAPELHVQAEARPVFPDVADVVSARAPTEPAAATDLVLLCMPWFENGSRDQGQALIAQCLDAGPSPERRAALGAAAAHLHLISGRAEEAAEGARAALAVSELPPRWRAIALMCIASPYAPAAEDIGLLDEAELLVSDGAPGLLLAVRSRRAITLDTTGKGDEAMELFSEIRREANERGYTLHEAQALLHQAGMFARRGRLAEAEESLVECERLSDEAAALDLRAAALSLRGTIAFHRGEPQRAIEIAEKRLAAADALGDVRGAAPALSTISAAALELGDLPRAREAGVRMAAVSRQEGRNDGVAAASFNLAMLATRAADFEDAGRWIAQAIDAARGAAPLEQLAVVAAGAVGGYAGDLDAAPLLSAADPAEIRYLDPTDRVWISGAHEVLISKHGEAVLAARRQAWESEPWERTVELAEQVAARLQAQTSSGG